MQIQTWSQSRETWKGIPTVSLTGQSEIAVGKHSFPWCFIHSDACWKASEVESDWGDLKKDLNPHLGKLICCTRAARCRCKKITFNFSADQCTTLFCTLLFAAGKRGVGLAVAGVQALVCTSGDRSNWVHPIACNVQPFSLLVNLSQQNPSAGTEPPQQDCPMARFNPAPHPTTHTTVGAGSETLVPQWLLYVLVLIQAIQW